MEIGFVTTSWPNTACAWSGHFVADLAEGLAERGHGVTVVAPSWRGTSLRGRAGVGVSSAPLSLLPSELPRRPVVWPVVLGALSRACSRAHQDRAPSLWVAHWWPTYLALPACVPAVAVVHGSDVDLAEAMPSSFLTGLTARLSGVVAVAGHLATRFGRLTETPILGTCPLGAKGAPADPVDLSDPLRRWCEDLRPKVLTVGRDTPAKGIAVARAAAQCLERVAWAVVTPEDGVGPREIRGLLAHADLVVVPSLDGADHPAEGHPHIITQALVAGTPLVGGPNRAVRTAMRAANQVEVESSGSTALVRAVRHALDGGLLRRQRDARALGETLRWASVLPRWEAALCRRVEAA